LDAICKIYERIRKQKKEKKQRRKKIEKGLGNPSAQKRKRARSPGSHLPKRYPFLPLCH
jgi:hypothetical protein